MRSNEVLDRARRAQVVASAIETIAERGYAHASLVQIAERAGTSKGVILYHFADKEELIGAVVAEVFAAAREHVGPQVAGQATAGARLRAYVEGRILFLATHRAHMQALLEIWVGHRRPDGRMLLGRAETDQALAVVEELLRAGQGSGEFRAFPVRPTAVAIAQAVDGALLQLIADPDLDLAEYARATATLFEHATRGTP